MSHIASLPQKLGVSSLRSRIDQRTIGPDAGGLKSLPPTSTSSNRTGCAQFAHPRRYNGYDEFEGLDEAHDRSYGTSPRKERWTGCNCRRHAQAAQLLALEQKLDPLSLPVSLCSWLVPIVILASCLPSLLSGAPPAPSPQLSYGARLRLAISPIL